MPSVAPRVTTPGVVPDIDVWRVAACGRVDVRPIVRALERIAERERERGSFTRVLNASPMLIVDQLDELFGEGGEENRARFARLLTALVATQKVWVATTLRARTSMSASSRSRP